MINRKDKKGVGAIIFFFIALLLILVIGFVAALIFGIVSFASDTITPITENLGVVGGTNLSQISEVTFGTANTVINISGWLIGFAYILALISSITFAVSYRMNPHPVFVTLYIGFIFFLIIGSILVSNMYQNLYTGNGVIAQQLHSQTLLSYMILYSPVIMVIIALITGIFMFALKDDNLTGGGYV